MKSGTTSLYSYLKNHPDVFMPANKEPAFFSNERIWNKGVKWYESLFIGQEDKKAVGEASVNYTKFPYYKSVPERIYALIPEVRLIYVLRSPVDRIYSHYLHNVYAGIEHDPLQKAIVEKPLYIQTSLYYTQIEQYLKHFDREQLLILLLDDMKEDPADTTRQVFEFLQVDSTYVPPNITEVRHQTKEKRGKDNNIMKMLRKTPLYPYLKEKIPSDIKSKAGLILKTKIQQTEPLSDSIKKKLYHYVSNDLGKMAAFLNRDLSFWEYS